jgi:hypothetical protein
VPSDDPAGLINRLVSGMSVPEQRELMATLLDQRTATWLSDLRAPRTPTLLRTPRKVRGFQVRLDLRFTKPPVWRRLALRGDVTLSELHSVIQGAMGWSDSHLHRFRTGADQNAAYFITEFDLDEGEDGIVEDRVRLDQVLANVGDGLWYEYDFGDGWDHVLKVEKVLPQPPREVQLLTGRRACPPEDVGGIGGYEAVAEGVESGYDDSLLPEQFDDAHHARDWLPVDWHPAEFDIEQARAYINRRA